MGTTRWALWCAIILLAGVMGSLAGCGDNGSPAAPQANTPPSVPSIPADQRVDVLFTYGSEKENWIKEATAAFNAANHKTKAGKIIVIDAEPMGSGDCIDGILTGEKKAVITSPASAAFIKLGNAQSRAKTNQDLVTASDNLVLSPVVIAMWKPMAEAIGWGTKPVGWAEILDLAKDPQGWAKYGHPEWGKFKFGHTHPEYSNSGLISVLAECYAGAGKTQGLTVADVNADNTAGFVQSIEQSIVHYGSSTGFFGKKMFSGGPAYLSAAVLYENMVIESYANPQGNTGGFPVVAIYPKEGTFWSDHPVGVVNREWVSDEQKEAAKVYTDYLLSADVQKRAVFYGFRPGNPAVTLDSPIDAAHGVNPKEPQNVLPVPEADVIDAMIKLWHVHKKHAQIVLVFDTSGSMNDDNKIGNARDGAGELIKLLDDDDTLGLLPFSTESHWLGQEMPMKTQRAGALSKVGGLTADGNTKLFDTIAQAYDYLQQHDDPAKISAVVVLTDGADTNSAMKLDDLINKIKSDSEKKGMRIFTIGYGNDAKKDELGKIADTTKAKFFEGKPENIRAVFREIATFF